MIKKKRISAGTTERTAVTGEGITVPQNAEQTACAKPFSSPAHPSHLPGMSPDIGMSLARAMAELVIMFRPPRPCVERPMAKTIAISAAETRRIFPNDMAAQSRLCDKNLRCPDPGYLCLAAAFPL